jgi:hypothetical protein
MERYRQVFGEWSVWITPDDDSLWQVIADADPNIIISIGNLGSGSGLWALPLWRRRTWLNISDVGTAPEAVFTSSLSLLMSLLEIEAFSDSPLVSLIPMGGDAGQVASSVRLITAGQDYDNIEVLVPNQHWNTVRDSLSGHIVATMLRRVPDALEDTPLCRLRMAMGSSRGSIMWPISLFNESISPAFLHQVVDKMLSTDGVNTVIYGTHLGPEKVLASLAGDVPWEIQHLLFQLSPVMGMRRFLESFPMQSLGALLSLLAVEPSTTFLESVDGSTIDQGLFTGEPDSTHNNLLRGAVAFGRVRLSLN